MAAELAIDEAEKAAETAPEEKSLPPASSGEAVDWDVAVDVAPPRPAGILRVTLAFAGRDKPLPADDPWAE